MGCGTCLHTKHTSCPTTQTCQRSPPTPFFALHQVSASLRQQYKHKDHLSSTYTCQAWGRAPGSKTSRRRQRSEGLGLLAVGTSAGRIIVWDLARAEVLHELGKVKQTQRPPQHSQTSLLPCYVEAHFVCFLCTLALIHNTGWCSSGTLYCS